MAIELCQTGAEKLLLKPPPLVSKGALHAPADVAQCHAASDAWTPYRGSPKVSGSSRVPPTAVMCGSVAGQEALTLVELPSRVQLREPLSPLAIRMGTLRLRASSA